MDSQTQSSSRLPTRPMDATTSVMQTSAPLETSSNNSMQMEGLPADMSEDWWAAYHLLMDAQPTQAQAAPAQASAPQAQPNLQAHSSLQAAARAKSQQSASQHPLQPATSSQAQEHDPCCTTSSSAKQVPRRRKLRPNDSQQPKGKLLSMKRLLPRGRPKQPRANERATAQAKRRVLAPAPSSSSTQISSGATTILQSSSPVPPEQGITIAEQLIQATPALSAPIPFPSMTTTCSTSVSTSPASLPLIAPITPTHIPIDPLDYVESAFDTCIAPNLTAPTPNKLMVRKHAYRKLVLDLARKELAIHSPHSIDDVSNLAVQCFELAGLM